MAKRAMTDAAKAIKAQAILDKTAKIFSVSDYNSVKMTDIAKEANISSGLLFVYFKTKEALFFNLLCREYEKRLVRLTKMATKSKINSFDDFKNLIMDELNDLVDNHSLYIRLEEIRSAILEKNTDPEMMLKLKAELYRQMLDFTSLICKKNILSHEEVMDIFQAEASIIIGCKLSASLPPAVADIIEKNRLHGFRRDFKTDVINTMKRYLDGYRCN